MYATPVVYAIPQEGLMKNADGTQSANAIGFNQRFDSGTKPGIFNYYFWIMLTVFLCFQWDWYFTEFLFLLLWNG
jgi:hypothetical protein